MERRIVVRLSGDMLRNRAACLLAAAGCLSGCANPFGKHDDDYARRVALARLREVSPADLERYRTPAPATDRGTPMEQAEVARARLATVEKIELTIEQCRAAALANNLDLKVALVNPAIAAQSISEEEARFESTFTLRSLWRSLDQPTASTLTAAQSESGFVEPGVTIPTRTGGNVKVTLPMQQYQDNNSFSTLNPSYSSDVQFSISHELLRGAGRRANTASLRIAGYNQQAAEARTKLEAIRQLAAADRSYWRLYQARRNLDVTQQQFDLAKEQLGRAERRVKAGNAPEVEVLRAQAGLGERMRAIIAAQNEVLLQTRELKRIINLEELPIESVTLVQTGTQPDPVEYTFEASALCRRAVAERMEMLELELRLAQDAVNIDFARNQTLPLLTLDYTYRVNGLGGSVQDSFRTLERSRFTDWEIGLSAQVPLGNEAANSRLRRALLERIQRLSSRAAREQAIRQEVLNACDDINAGWQRILAARQSVILDTRLLEAEQRQFEVGNRTSTDVLNAAAKLAESQLAEIRSLTDYQISQVDLAFATGTMLGAAKVGWSPLDAPAAEAPLIPFRQLYGDEATEPEQISPENTDPASAEAAGSDAAGAPAAAPTNGTDTPVPGDADGGGAVPATGSG